MSDIIVKNQTGENVRVAIFKKNYKQPTLQTVAWEIVAPPQGGQTTVPVPTTYEVFANYPGPNDPKTDPYAGNQTVQIIINQSTGRFLVSSSKTEDGKSVVATISQTFQDLVPEEIHIVNTAGFGVWGHITKGGADIYPSEVIAPGSTLLADVRPTFYLAVVAEYVFKGDRLVDEEISSTATPILLNQTATVTGTKWTGYGISAAGA